MPLPSPDVNSSPGRQLRDGKEMLRISGSVHNFDGTPIGDAHIMIRDLAHGNHSYTTSTDAAGNFTLYNLPPGSYEVSATRGTDEAREQVQLIPGSVESNVELRMRGNAAAGTGGGSTVSIAEYEVPAKARALYEKAAEAYVRGKKDEAQKKVDAALAEYPKYARALTLRGLLRVDAGRKDEAIGDFTEAIQQDPHYLSPYLALASLYNSSGRFDDALPLLSQAERLASNVWETYFELSRANVGKSQFRAALANIDRASRLAGGPEKELPEFHLVRGYALMGLAQIPQAVAEFNAYLAKKPNGQVANRTRDLVARLQAASSTSASN
jgi:tetratricopeptide (TPR) repeat protein